MVLGNRAADAAALLANGRDGHGGLGRGLQRREPAAAEARGPANRGLRCAAEPERKRRLLRAGTDRRALQGEVLALEIDRLAFPEPGHDLERLVRSSTSIPGAAAGGLPLGGVAATDSDRGQEASIAQEVEGRALPRKAHRISKGKNDRIGAELEASGRARHDREQRHRLERQLPGDHSIRLPDGVDLRVLAEIQPGMELGHRGEGKAAESHADADAHAHFRSTPGVRRSG